MGQLTLQGLMRGSPAGRVTVFELREDRRKMAEAYGPAEIADPESEEGKRLIKSNYRTRAARISASTSAQAIPAFHLADSLTRQAGKLIIGTFHRGDVSFNGTKWHLGGLIGV